MPKRTFRIREGEPLLDIASYGRALAIGHAVNDQAWTKNAIATGKDARDGGHQVVAIHVNL